MAENVTFVEAPAAVDARAALTRHRRPLNALTGIRFFAALYVVIFHTRVGSLLHDHGHYAAGNFFLNGYLAVPLFFLLSGFILAYTYESQIERPGDHRRFWEARFARIWPVYFVSLLVSSLAYGGGLPHLGPALATLFMVQAWNPFNPGLAGAWNLVCWTLSVEALFYLVFPWVQVWLERRGVARQLRWVAGMLLACVLLNSATRSLGYTPYGAYRYVPLPLLHLPEFFTGIGLGNYFLSRLSVRTDDEVPGRGLWTYGFALASVALLCVPANRWTSLVVIALSGLIYGLAAERTWLSRFLSTPALLLGGGISYSIYLFQMPAKAFVGRMHLHSETVKMGATFALLLVLSYLMFVAVENPARRLLRGVFARMETRRTARTLTRA